MFYHNHIECYLEVVEGGIVAIDRGSNFHVKMYILVVARANISISVPQTPSLDVAVQ